MPTEDSSSKRNIVLRHCHEEEFRGRCLTVDDSDARWLLVPNICGCSTTFAPTGWSETGEDGILRDVWKQVGFYFKEYEHESEPTR